MTTKTLLKNYLQVNQPHFIESYLENAMGFEVQSPIRSKFYNQTLVPNAVNLMRKRIDFASLRRARHTMSLEFGHRFADNSTVLAAHGYELLNQEFWFERDLGSEKRQLPSVGEQVRQVTKDNFAEFRDAVEKFYESVGVPSGFFRTTEAAISTPEFKLYLGESEPGVAEVVAGVSSSTELKFAHINFILKLNRSSDLDQLIMNLVAAELSQQEINTIFLIGTGDLSTWGWLLRQDYALRGSWINFE